MASPKSLMQALYEKYSEEDSNIDGIKIRFRVPKGAPGFSEDGSLVLAQHLSLNGTGIDVCGKDEALQSSLCRVLELDLADNKLTEWSEVFKICTCTPNITFLNLSRNLLKHSSLSVEEAAQNFCLEEMKIEGLVLNNMDLDWTAICKILQHLQRIKELHLSLNSLQTVDCGQLQFSNVEVLHLNGNQIGSWQDIERLGYAFPCLQRLVMTDVPLRTFQGGELPRLFPKLQSLNISKTLIAEWTEVQKLRHLPCLTDLKITGVPVLLGMEEIVRRQMLIALLPNVERMNGSKIGDMEREDAERAYIRRFSDSTEKPSRCLELEEKHGQLSALVDVKFEASDDVELIVVYKEKSQLVKVNTKKTVVQLKKQLESVCGLPASEMRLFLRIENDYHGDNVLNYPKKQLYTYHISPGDSIFIEPK